VRLYLGAATSFSVLDTLFKGAEMLCRGEEQPH